MEQKVVLKGVGLVIFLCLCIWKFTAHFPVTNAGSAAELSVVSQASGSVGEANTQYVVIDASASSVAISSSAQNIVTGTLGGKTQVIVSHNGSGFSVISKNQSTGVPGNAHSYVTDISSDGSKIVFYSAATNLVDSDTNSAEDVFVYDTQNQTLKNLTFELSSTETGLHSRYALTGKDGSAIVFASLLRQLTSHQDSNGVQDIFINTPSGTQLVTASHLGQRTANGASSLFSFTENGRFVGYHTFATDITDANDVTPGGYDAYIYDVISGGHEMVAVNQAGQRANAESFMPSISQDGRYVVFTSFATNLDERAQTSAERLYLRDRLTNQVRCLVVLSGSCASSRAGRITADGQLIIFTSTGNLTDDPRAYAGVKTYSISLQGEQLTHISSVEATGTANQNSAGAHHFVSSNGRFVAFITSTTLKSPDRGFGGSVYYTDAYLWDRFGQETWPPDPFLQLPIEYSGSFAQASLGNAGTLRGRGRVNSWLDHDVPRWQNVNDEMLPWHGQTYTTTASMSNCVLGVSCYDSHTGIDFQRSQVDEEVVAAADGTVITAHSCESCGGFGSTVLIDHGEGIATFYAHLDSIAEGVTAGSVITAGHTIGIMGNSGCARFGCGVHLHFEVRYDPDENWPNTSVIDPYGWSGEGTDPLFEVEGATQESAYLWEEDINSGPVLVMPDQQTVIIGIDPPTRVTVPAWSVAQPGMYELVSIPGLVPFPTWQTPSSAFLFEQQSNNQLYAQQPSFFSEYVTVTVPIPVTQTEQLDVDFLQLFQLPTGSTEWISVPGSYDPQTEILTAYITQTGTLLPLAPLLCPQDQREYDNMQAAAFRVDQSTVLPGVIAPEHDQDWWSTSALSQTQVVTISLSSHISVALSLFDQNDQYIATLSSGESMQVEQSVNTTLYGVVADQEYQTLAQAFTAQSKESQNLTATPCEKEYQVVVQVEAVAPATATPTPSFTPSSTPTVPATQVPTSTATPPLMPTDTPTVLATYTLEPSSTPTVFPTATIEPTSSATPTLSPTVAIGTPTPYPSHTPTPQVTNVSIFLPLVVRE